MAARTATRKTAPAAGKLEFVGPPRGLVAVGDIPDIRGDEAVTGPVSEYLGDTRALRLSRAGRRGAARLRLRLSPTTPPGDYEGAIGSDGSAIAFAARVLPETRLSVLAGELAFTGVAGNTATATLALSNDGNTQILMPKALAIGLFDDDGIETAFAATYAKEASSLDAFFETFHGRLREAHSGLQKLVVARGAGSHAPGSSFVAEFALDLAKPLRAGHRYHGVASFDFGELPITVSVKNGAVE